VLSKVCIVSSLFFSFLSFSLYPAFCPPNVGPILTSSVSIPQPYACAKIKFVAQVPNLIKFRIALRLHDLQANDGWCVGTVIWHQGMRWWLVTHIRERNPSLRCSWMFLSSMTLMHAIVISSSIFSTDLIGDQSHGWSVFSHHVWSKKKNCEKGARSNYCAGVP
jgi:hypothetical protein